MNSILKTTRNLALGQLMLVLSATLSAGASANLPDPTRPVTAAQLAGTASTVPGAETLTLQSVLIAGDRQLAIINGRRVQVGDTIGRSRVIHIDAGEVQLRRDGQLQTLTVYNRPAGFVRGQP